MNQLKGTIFIVSFLISTSAIANNCEDLAASFVTEISGIINPKYVCVETKNTTKALEEAKKKRLLELQKELKGKCPEDNDANNQCKNYNCPGDLICKIDRTASVFGIPQLALTVTETGVFCTDGKYWSVSGSSIKNTTIYCPCKCFDKSCPPKDENQSFNKHSTSNIKPPDECDDGSLVKLSNLTAKPTNKGISLSWATKTEPDSQGFKMWRAIPKLDSYCGCSRNIEDYTQIQVLDKKGKPVLIPAEGNKTSGHDYSYLDKDAKPGIAYCYALEDVDSKGESKFYFKYIAFTQPKQDKEVQ